MMQGRSSCYKDDFVELYILMYICSKYFVDGMSQSLVDNGSAQYNVVHMFLYFTLYIYV
jgi:hypothetical protein